jgi:DNA-binding transcriptional LysR family regulator
MITFRKKQGEICMNLNQYEIFCRTAELRSLTKAAEAEGITQSAVSHIVANLEKEFGVPLLIRSRTGARLTPEGERLLPCMQAVVSADARLRQAAAAVRGPDSGTVRIGTFTSVAVHWLPGILKEFQTRYPLAEVKMLNGDYRDVNTWLQEGSVDLAFTTLPAVPGCRTVPLMTDRLLAILPPEHRLAASGRIPLRELAGEPFISLLEGSNQDARRALEAAGIAPDIKYITKDDYAIIAMVGQGLGVSILPGLLLEGRSDGVRVAEISPPVSRTIALAYPAGVSPAPIVSRFADCVTAWVRSRAAGERKAP